MRSRRDAPPKRVMILLFRQLETELRKKDGDLTSGLVLADALEEHGDQQAAATARHLVSKGPFSTRAGRSPLGPIDKTYRIASYHEMRRELAELEDALRFLGEPKRRIMRKRRTYAYHRRRGLPAKEAFGLAKRHGHLRPIGHLGDVNWPEYEGGPVYRDEDGVYWLDWIMRVGRRFIVYRVRLDREPLPNWVNVRNLTMMDYGPSKLRRDWYSRNPMVRAHARLEVALYYGWDNLDQDPLRLTRKEIRETYRR